MAVATAADATSTGAGFLDRFMDGVMRRLKPRMSLLVVDFSLNDSESETSESVRDQRLWQEMRGALGAFVGLYTGSWLCLRVDAQEGGLAVDAGVEAAVEARGRGRADRAEPSWVECLFGGGSSRWSLT